MFSKLKRHRCIITVLCFCLAFIYKEKKENKFTPSLTPARLQSSSFFLNAHQSPPHLAIPHLLVSRPVAAINV